MSRSPRRRKDTAGCRCCDQSRVARDGSGRCPTCNGRRQVYKDTRQAPPADT